MCAGRGCRAPHGEGVSGWLPDPLRRVAIRRRGARAGGCGGCGISHLVGRDPPLARVDAVVVDARVAAAHEPGLLVELPVLVAVAAPPLARGVVGLVLEAHGDAAALVAPQLLAQAVVELARPLAAQEVLDRLAPLEELVAVAPLRVLGVGERD